MISVLVRSYNWWEGDEMREESISVPSIESKRLRDGTELAPSFIVSVAGLCWIDTFMLSFGRQRKIKASGISRSTSIIRGHRYENPLHHSEQLRFIFIYPAQQMPTHHWAQRARKREHQRGEHIATNNSQRNCGLHIAGGVES